MTSGADTKGEGTATAVPRPGSVADAALQALVAFAEAERLVGSLIAHEGIDGILTEHALALEQVRDGLREHAAAAMNGDGAREAMALLEEQIAYIREIVKVGE